MSWGEEQKKEIETIRERKITVKLSDADCDRLARKCGEHGLTIGDREFCRRFGGRYLLKRK